MSDMWMAGPVTSVAYGWRLERGDGVTLGFTSHDRDVVQGGMLLLASPGMQPSSIVETMGLETDGLEVNGALTSDAIRTDDLAAGRWDAAYLEIFLFDWTEPDAGRRLLASGELGSVSFSGDAFEAEFLGLTRKLDRSIVPQTSPSCRARFCGCHCGLSRQRFRHLATVASVDDSQIVLTDAPTAPDNKFAYGEVRWLGGKNCGLTADIVASDGDSISLIRPPHWTVLPGDRLELIEGCDKQMATCATRFANAINFRGEPYLPGNDLLTRYPGAS